MSERTITSDDGTHIVYEQHGQGPPLVLVHAGFVDRTIWGPSLPLLAQHYTVYALDRRGHGRSDPYPVDHDIEREYEDVVALIAAVGAPVALLGHSSGACVALHAARRTAQVRHLVLYEPPRFEAFTPAVRARLYASLAAGDLDSIVATVFLDIVETTLDMAPWVHRAGMQEYVTSIHAGAGRARTGSATVCEDRVTEPAPPATIPRLVPRGRGMRL
jgi:pimeloyl-ACP methyl ester carboxylesterase